MLKGVQRGNLLIDIDLTWFSSDILLGLFITHHSRSGPSYLMLFFVYFIRCMTYLDIWENCLWVYRLVRVYEVL